jgi:thioredoxin 2
VNPQGVIVVCPQCGVKNRIPIERRADRAVCGKCHSRLPLSAPFPSRPVEVSDGTFNHEVLVFPGPVLLEFYATWCGYCQKLAPVLDELASEYEGRVKIAKIDVDRNPATASQYKISGTPSLFLFKNGRLVHQIPGFVPKNEIERHLAAIL